MNSHQSANDQWAQCPEGQFSQLAKSLRRQTQRRRFLTISATAAAGSLAGIGLWSLVQTGKLGPFPGAGSVPSYDYGGITCEAVKQNMGQYISLQCAPEMIARIDAHIEQCLSCRHLIDLAKRQQEIKA